MGAGQRLTSPRVTSPMRAYLEALSRRRHGHSDGSCGNGRPHQFSRPDVNSQPARIVENRILPGEGKTDRCRQVVALNLRFSLFKRPWNVVEIRPDRLACAIGAEKAGALGQKVFEGSTAVLRKLPA